MNARTQPVSEAKLAANRENARLSTGPKTAEGKSRSSRNSFKHGLYSRQLVLDHEDPAKLDQLRADLRAEHQPANTTEEILVNELAEQYWRLLRFRACEVAAWTTLDLLPRLQRAIAAAERGFHKALAALRQLQKDRGFVPSLSAEPALDASESQTEREASNKPAEPSHPIPPTKIEQPERLCPNPATMFGFDSQNSTTAPESAELYGVSIATSPEP